VSTHADSSVTSNPSPTKKIPRNLKHKKLVIQLQCPTVIPRQEHKVWNLSIEHIDRFLSKLKSYTESGIQLTPCYLQESFKRYIDSMPELSEFKCNFYNSHFNWFDKLIDEHPMLGIQLIVPNVTIEHSLPQLALVAHFSTLRILYKNLLANNSTSHPERIYSLEEYILRIPTNAPTTIDVTKGHVNESKMQGSKIVTILFGANPFGHKVPPVVILPGHGLKPSFKKKFPLDWRLITTSDGRPTAHCFQFWVEHFANLKQAGRMLLLLNDEMKRFVVNLSPELLQVLEDAEITIHFLHHTEKQLNPLGYSTFV
jgi:hypothetical protein